jgi:hypothetical protein
MGKTRIVVICPETGIVVITKIAYDDMIEPNKGPHYFACPCGMTHRLSFAGRHRASDRPPPLEKPRAS